MVLSVATTVILNLEAVASEVQVPDRCTVTHAACDPVDTFAVTMTEIGFAGKAAS